MAATLEGPFGRFRIERLLGEGGMGAVYLAHDSALDRLVAIKIPHRSDTQILERFQREAKLAARITHPSLCPIHEVGCLDGTHYLVMTFLDGVPLAAYLAAGEPLPVDYATAIIGHLASVLHLLHGHGIIHRDLKPGNVMIRTDGTPVLMDFGLARPLDGSTQLTTEGKVFGTPAYMAPEQIDPKVGVMGPATDVWALGVIFYQMLTGQVPFSAESVQMLLARVLMVDHVSPSQLRPGLDSRWDATCALLLAKDPTVRPQTMAEVMQLVAPGTSLHSPTLLAISTPTIPVSTHREHASFQESTLVLPPNATRRRPWLLAGVSAALLGTIIVSVLVVLALSDPAPLKTGHRAGDATAVQAATTDTVARLSFGKLEPLTIVAGDSRTVAVPIERTHCSGVVQLQCDGQIEGVQVQLESVPADQDVSTLRIRINKDAKPGTYQLQLSALGAANVRAQHTLKLEITPAPQIGPAALALVALAPVQLETGSSVRVRVRIDRTNYAGGVELLTTGTIAGVQTTFEAIAAGANEGYITLRANAEAKPGDYTLSLVARGLAQLQTMSDLKVRILARPLVAALTIPVLPRVEITAGQKKVIPVQIVRDNFKGEVRLESSERVEGVEIAFKPVAADAEAGELQLAVSPQAKSATHSVRIVATGPGTVRAERIVYVAVKAAVVQEKQFKNSLGMELVLIPRGKFVMGSPQDESERSKDEGPQHTVEISRPFFLGVHEVTQEEFEKVMGKNPSYFFKDGTGAEKVKGLNTGRFPVEQVTYEEAVEFCKRLSARAAEKQQQRVYRLPTEAEWEYACRGGQSTYQIFHQGAKLSSREANFNGKHPYGGAASGPYLERTSEVGSYKPNAFGLYDMHGNVWEWCSDWYDKDYYRICQDDQILKDPTGPKTGKQFVFRGGSWGCYGRICRTAVRDAGAPANRGIDVGFRVVCVAP